MQGIVDAAIAAGFFGLPARYAYGEPTCPLYTADSPRTFITVTAGDRSKRIEHDYGCENGPKARIALRRFGTTPDRKSSSPESTARV